MEARQKEKNSGALGTCPVCPLVNLDGPGVGSGHTKWTCEKLESPIYKISYDLSYDYRKFAVRATYDSDLKRAEISLRNIVS